MEFLQSNSSWWIFLICAVVVTGTIFFNAYQLRHETSWFNRTAERENQNVKNTIRIVNYRIAMFALSLKWMFVGMLLVLAVYYYFTDV